MRPLWRLAPRYCRSLVSATCYTVLGVANKMVTVLVNLMLWDRHASPAGIISLLVCLLGAALYKQAPMRSAEEPPSWVHSLVRSPNVRHAAVVTSLLLTGAAAGYGVRQMQLPGGDLAWTDRMPRTDGGGRKGHAIPYTSGGEIGGLSSGPGYGASKGVQKGGSHHAHSTGARGEGTRANRTHSVVARGRGHGNHTHLMAAKLLLH